MSNINYKRIDLDEVFSTENPPLTYTVKGEGAYLLDNILVLSPTSRGETEIVVEAKDSLGQVTSTSFTLDSNGEYITASADEPRDAHYVNLGTEAEPNYVRTLLLEPEATNTVAQSNDLSTWWTVEDVTLTKIEGGAGRGVLAYTRDDWRI